MKYYRINRTKKIIQETIESFGKPIVKKRNISNIKLFNDVDTSDEKLIDNKTWEDLEMDNIFKFIDRTSSKTGEQYLYNLLHKRQSKEKKENLNLKVNYYQDNFKKGLNNTVLLKKYNSTSSYTLPSLLYGERFYKIPNWVVILGFLAFLLGALSFLDKSFFVSFIILGLINTLLHYYFKQKINTFHYDFINLKSFYVLYLKLIRNDNEIAILSNIEKKKLNSISKKCLYLTMNIEFADELTSALYYILELIKAWFLLDAMQFNNTLKLIKINSKLLQKVFCYIGLIDSAIAIVSVKKGIKGCEPTYTKEQKLSMVNAYHPLVENCTPNSMTLNVRNAIITGGNMSGKTTFLKTVGVNIILSQTINYSFSEEILIPNLNIISSITNEDDIEKGHSYFMSELLRAKHMFETVESDNLVHLILFDEIFKGTNSKDRIALASSLLSSLSNLNCFVIVTTHDLAIVDFINKTYKTFYFNHLFINDQVNFDYKIREGIQNDTNVIDLIKSLNFSQQIISDTISFNEIITKKAHNSK